MNVNNCPTRCDKIQFYYISADSSICFGWYPHPSSRAHTNCNYSIWHWSKRICYLPLTWRSRSSDSPPRQLTVANTVRPVPDVVITIWVCSWWLMRISSETYSAVCRNIIKLYIVASCWTIIDIIKLTYGNVWSSLFNQSILLIIKVLDPQCWAEGSHLQFH